jgi:uncharacterized protein YbjT (DUF2867 family)
MNPNPMRSNALAGAAVALVTLLSSAASTAQPTDASPEAQPVIVAQAAAGAAAPTVANVAVYPPYQRGVRMAAAEGPEALRRYIWRTRMIYNFYYNDFALRR